MSPFSRFSLYFTEVARSGSLRKAAERLHVSASAINRQILQAEDSFGIALFERLPDGMRMTTAGELLYSDLLRWQHDFSLTRQRFDEIQGLRRGQVSIGLVQALTEGRLSEEITSIAREEAWLNLQLNVGSSTELTQKVRETELDFGLILDPETVSGVEVLAFAELEMGIVLPPHHRLNHRKNLSLSELRDERHILPGNGLVVYERVRSLYARTSQLPETAISCNDIRLIRTLIADGAGVCVLSWLDVMEDVRAGKLAFIPLRNRVLRPLTLGLCTVPSRQLSRAALHVIKRLSAVIEIMHAESLAGL